MDNRKRRAFTLTELLIVIAIIGVIAALLMPVFGNAYAVAKQTQCKKNLATIYEAQAAWRGQNGGNLLVGKAWMGRLLDYVDADRRVFMCPARGLTGHDLDSPSMYVENSPTTSGTASTSDPSSGTAPAPDPTPSPQPTPQPPQPQQVDYAFEFNIYWQSPQGSKQRGAFAWNIPLDSHPWVRREDHGNYVTYMVDDEGYTGDAKNPPTFDDIKFNIYYENGQPTKVQILQQQCTSSPIVKYIYDFKVNDQVFISNWVSHISGGSGETFYFDQPGPPPDPTPPGPGYVPAPVSVLPPPPIWVVLGDYGINRGCYAAAERLVTQLDYRMFYVIDYALPIANYAGIDLPDDWNKYFIEDTVAWTKKYGSGGDLWYNFQSLRHFDQANVLFCDGHIESLGSFDLRETDPRWHYTGR